MHQVLPSFRSCFFCGTGNRSGLHIRYHHDPDRDRVYGSVTPDSKLCGYPDVLHGGIQAALLDDVMFWAVAHHHATSCATLELTCTYHTPAALGQAFELEATAGTADGRKARAKGRLLSSGGAVVASARALYLLHSPERFRTDVLPLLDFEGCKPAMAEHFSNSRPVPTAATGKLGEAR